MPAQVRSPIDPRRFVLLTVLLGGMGQGVVAPRMPELLHGSQTLARDSGLSATILYLAIFLSTYAYGSWADRGHAHRFLAAGLLGYALTLVGLARAESETAVFVLRFAEGLSLSAVFVAADFVLGRLSASHERGRWLSYYGVALSAGLLLGPLLALAAGLHALYLVAALAVALAWPAAALHVRAAREHGASGRLPLAPLVAGTVYGFMEAGIVAVFPVLAVEAFGVRPELCLIAVILSAAVFSLVWGEASDRVGARSIVFALLGALAVGALALAAYTWTIHGPGAALAMAAAVFFGLIAGGLYPVGFSWLLEGLPEARYGFASGSFARAYGLGSLAGPLTAGLATQKFGAPGLFAALAAAGAVGLAGCLATARGKRR